MEEPIKVEKTYEQLFSENLQLVQQIVDVNAENAQIREMAEKILHHKRALEAENAQIKTDIQDTAKFIMEKFGLGNPDANIGKILMSLANKLLFSGKEALANEFAPIVTIVTKYIKPSENA
jgi:hypothetical protein